MTRAIAVVVGVLVPAVCLSQTLLPSTSTGTTAAHMASAAGQPLMDGTLPPGTLTVRIVRGAFDENLAGKDVVIDVLGGKSEKARTGADGRVRLALPMGAHVRASADVDGERLESDVFVMPPDTGVRVLLVAAGATSESVPVTEEAFLAAAAPGLMAATPVADAATFAAPAAPPAAPAPPSRAAGAGGTLMAGTLAFAAVIFGTVVIRRRKS